jgi:DNA-binding protein HU-beta
MNQAELVSAIATSTSLTKDQASKALAAALDAISDALKNGGDVRLAGFGSFEVKATEERTGRNPRTGETIKIAASKKAVFKAGKGLRDSLNA